MPDDRLGRRFPGLLSRHQRVGLGLAFLLAGTAVAMGAVGSHIVNRYYPEGASTYAIALRYHTLHALALILLSILASQISRGLTWVVGSCFVVGLILFSGLLYLKAFQVIQVTGPLVPVGGMSLIFGWLIWGGSFIWSGRGNRS